MKIILTLLSLFSLSIVASAIDNDGKKGKPFAELHKQIQGKWILSGTPDKITPAPKAGGRIKTIKGNTWEIVQKHPETGDIIFRHGGTFTLKGNIYTEFVDHADDSTKGLIGNEFKFKLEVKEGLLFNHGKGNPWTEAWRPVK